MNTTRFCPDCGLPLAPDAPSGLCPQCLLKSALPTQAGDAEPAAPAVPRPVPIPGERFGEYRILRLLGQGGMGEVYEAEEATTGRRIALKVMSRALVSEQDRKRFLREGRLAASVNHPNVVYIHGSAEIADMPVIAMELVHGGTLKDRLKRSGPLPVADAAEAGLQIIAGLEAAQAAGVLHRDIKPANCFVAGDGTVKIGDFGLSVSTLARGESLLTATGAVLGTPAYASPEQLRGEELDMTSDIYSVGATLYHLLTGKTPFAATDFVKLITEVLDKEPLPAHTIRAEVPIELSRIVARCLAKDRKARFQSYAELREALLPFSDAAVEPAKPALRFLAALLDDTIAYGPSLLFLIYWSFDPLDKLMRERTPFAALSGFLFYLWYLLYYSIAEGLWGAALGKSVCGIRVVGLNRQAAGIPRALLRTLIYMAPFTLPSLLLMAWMPMGEMRAAIAREATLMTDWIWLPLLLLLFVTMRKRNGFAAVQDLLSGTRVIVRPKAQTRPILEEPAQVAQRREAPELPPIIPAISRAHGSQLGPYQLQGSLWTRNNEELIQAFDPALHRKVWIHVRPANSQPVSPARHDVSRPARLRWLNGGRTETELWDAYEAVNGAPLLNLCQRRQSWRAVRFWLLDLSKEASAAVGDPENAATLSLDRVWISNAGHALLLDFPSPGRRIADSDEPVCPGDIAGMQQFLNSVARTALEGNVVRATSSGFATAPVPTHAQSFLRSLAEGAFEKGEFIVGNLLSLVSRPAEITRPWRAASLTLVPAIILIFGLAIAGMVSFERIRRDRAWSKSYPGRSSFHAAAQIYLSTLEQERELNRPNQDSETARAYLVQHFGTLITNDSFWAQAETGRPFSDGERGRLRQAVTGQPPSVDDLQEAEKAMPVRIKAEERQERMAPLWVLLGAIAIGLLIVALVELFGYLLFRQSPTLRLFGMVVVNRDGRRATRGRLLLRWLIVWLPTTVFTLLMAAALLLTLLPTAVTGGLHPEPAFDFLPHVPPVGWLFLAIAGLVGVSAVSYALIDPGRSLQDRLGGTRLVPR